MTDEIDVKSLTDALDDEDTQFIPILSNEPNELKLHTLELIYNSVAYGQLGYCDGKDPVTGEIVPLLVGLDPLPDGSGFAIYPVARILGKNDPLNYLVPDGIGNYQSADGDGAIVRLAGEAESGPPEGFDKTKLN